MGLDLLEGAEGVFVEIGAPSRLGTAVLLTFLETLEEGDPTFHTESATCALMGYACRMSQGRSVPSGVAGPIEGNLRRDARGQIDFERMEDGSVGLIALVRDVARLALDTRVLAYLADCSLHAWTAFTASATHQLRGNLVKSGMKRSYLLPEDTVENLLCVGYLVRVVDEVAGLEPLARPSAL